MAPTTYVLTHRLSRRRRRASADDARAAFDDHVDRAARHADVIHDSSLGRSRSRRRRRIVRLRGDASWHRDHAVGAHESVIVEPRVEYWPHFIGGSRPQRHTAAASRPDARLEVTVTGGGTPLAGAEVTLLAATPDGQSRLLPPVRTDTDGRAILSYDSSWTVVVVGAYPRDGWWSDTAVSPTAKVELACERLASDGPLGWWHRAMGIDGFRAGAGEGIRVGLIGTGVTPHPCLGHVRRLDDKDDLAAHGTHVCGILGARPVSAGQYGGLAPGAEILTLRVFEEKNGRMVPPDQGDLAHALEDFCAGDERDHVDLVNLSLGSDHCIGLEDAIEHAFENGVVCVCSAGNTGGTVEFPAAHDQTLAISALGRRGSAPTTSATTYFAPPEGSDRVGSGELYLSVFSCSGPEIDGAGPGAGIISTVPPHAGAAAPYAAMDGTSLACPAVCGALAVALSESPEHRSLPRDISRSRSALEIFTRRCVDIGLAAAYEGRGLLRESRS